MGLLTKSQKCVRCDWFFSQELIFYADFVAVDQGMVYNPL